MDESIPLKWEENRNGGEIGSAFPWPPLFTIPASKDGKHEYVLCTGEALRVLFQDFFDCGWVQLQSSTAC